LCGCAGKKLKIKISVVTKNWSDGGQKENNRHFPDQTDSYGFTVPSQNFEIFSSNINEAGYFHTFEATIDECHESSLTLIAISSCGNF
jgi:hypothetical protein